MTERDKIHKTWHEFCKYMQRWYFTYNYNLKYKRGKFIKGSRKYKNFDSSKVIGYRAQLRTERFAKTHPDVKIVKVDDSVFSSSIIALIPHPKMGITVLFIPQSSEVKNQFFLYPHHLNIFLQELGKMGKKCKLKFTE